MAHFDPVEIKINFKIPTYLILGECKNDIIVTIKSIKKTEKEILIAKYLRQVFVLKFIRRKGRPRDLMANVLSCDIIVRNPVVRLGLLSEILEKLELPYPPSVIFSYTCSCRIHTDAINKQTQEDFFIKICTSHFIARVRKGLLKVCV